MLRFLIVIIQTVISPLVTSLLFLLVLSLAIGNVRGEVLGVPFLAIPYPFAKDNHQYENANYYKKKGCCWILNQENLNFNTLREIFAKILDNHVELNLKRICIKRLNNSRRKSRLK